MDRDPYEVLGVPGTASGADIRSAYWALARKYHPDVTHDDPDAGRKFIEARDAAEALLIPRRGVPRRRPGPSTTPARPAAAVRTPPPAAATAAKPRPESPPEAVRDSPFIIVAAIAAFATAVLALVWVVSSSALQRSGVIPANGALVWRVAHYSLNNGWGINLAGDGARIAIVPGTSTDIEVSGGYLSGTGHIAVLPPGESLTYQHCVTAVQKVSSQSEPLSEITPGPHGSLCVTGGGGDLAGVKVARDNGSSLTMNIIIWEYV